MRPSLSWLALALSTSCASGDDDGRAAPLDAPRSAGAETAAVSVSDSGQPASSAAAPPPASAPTSAPAPVERRGRPSAKEWSTAPEVARATGCVVRALGDWVRLERSDVFWERGGDWGAAGTDNFEDFKNVEIRLRPGRYAAAWHTRSRLQALFVWPTRAVRPTITLAERSAGAEPIPPPRPLPTVPAVDEPPPSEADWFVATPVNTASPTLSRQCRLAAYGQWARMECRATDPARGGLWPRWNGIETFGEKNRDVTYAQINVLSDVIRLEFRMRRGARSQASIPFGTDSDGLVEVRYEWPANAPQPTVLSIVEKYP